MIGFFFVSNNLVKSWIGWLYKSLYTVTHSTSTWIPRCNLQLARISILLKDSSSSSAGVQHPKEQRTDPFEEPGQQFAHVGSSLSFFIPKGLQTMGAFFLMVSSYAQMRKYSLLRIWSTQPTDHCIRKFPWEKHVVWYHTMNTQHNYYFAPHDDVSLG